MMLKRISESSLIQILILGSSILLFFYGVWNSYFGDLDDFYWTGLMHHRESFLDAAKGVGNGVRFLYFPRYWVLDRLFGINAAPFFWLGLFQHFIITIMVYGLLVFWTKKKSLAFLAALFFATKFSYYEVITSTSATSYSFWAFFYFLSLTLFVLYLDKRKIIYYIGAVFSSVILSLGHDYTLNLPLILLAYHFTLGLGSRSVRSLGWKDFRLHIPFWIIWGIHVGIQFLYILQGTSEAVTSAEVYQPGLHMFRNLLFLVFLIVPNVHMPPVYNFLSSYFNSATLELLWQFTIGLSIISGFIAVIAFWKGSPLVRFALALIFLPFLQYLMWGGDNANATRYLYIPSVGFSILLALLLIYLHNRLKEKGKPWFRFIVPSMVVLILLLNGIVIQTYVQQQVRNAQLQRAFVTQLASNYQFVKPGSMIYIEVPELDFTDLEGACLLVFPQPVKCDAFVSGERTPDDLDVGLEGKPVYWLQATNEGIIQKYPADSNVQ